MKRRQFIAGLGGAAAWPRAQQSAKSEIEAAGQSLGGDLVIINAADEPALENAFAWMNEQQIRALLISADPLFLTFVFHIAGLANQFKIAALYTGRSQAVAGALMSYGPNLESPAVIAAPIVG